MVFPFCSIAHCYCDKHDDSRSIAETGTRCFTELIETLYCRVLVLQLLKCAGTGCC